MKRLYKIVYYRIVLAIFAVIVQIALLIIVLTKFNNYQDYFYALFGILSFLIVLFIVNKNMNPEYKIAWIIPILLFPIFGWLFYLMLSGNRLSNRLKEKMKYVREKYYDSIDSDNILLNEIKDKCIASQAQYIEQYAHCPLYRNSYANYFPTGESLYFSLIEELEKAEKFIFLEFFIIEEGIMWNSILDILKQKAKQGIEVRVIYDYMGCIMTLPYKYDKMLESFGIKCSIFNPFKLTISSKLNNRDHQKIIVIDGKSAYTGGINLADEYINVHEKYGYWKDGGILVKGAGVHSFTVMFLTMWNYLKNIDENFDSYKIQNSHDANTDYNGYIQPYNDNPLNDELVGENVYLNLITRAKEYVYIATPYLIIDYKMQSALCLAAKQGVDVRIITPYIPDKKHVNMVTKANYKELIKCGIKIYEYLPGFIHSKLFLTDDHCGTVGTINLDYRSLYLHFECGVWMYNTNAIIQMKQDFTETFEQCKTVSLEECENVNIVIKITRTFFKMFAFLM